MSWALVRMALAQARHDLTSLRRNPLTLILSVGFPLLFFVLIAAMVGNVTLDERQGVRLAQFLAPAFASFGVVMATLAFLAYGFAEAKSTGVLKRLGGTPLPTWVLLAGRVLAALVLGLVASVLVIGVGVAFYQVQIIWRTVPAAVFTIVLASLCFSMIGLALATILPNPQLTLAVTSGLSITLGFFSDIFMFGGTSTGWISWIGWLFPLKHLVNAFGDAFNPFLVGSTGSGFAADHLAVILAWGVVAGLAAAAFLRRERRTTSAARAAAPSSVAKDAVPRRSGRPGILPLLGDQVRHTSAVLWRDAGSVFFAVAFPVLLVVVIPTVNGGGEQILGNGVQFGAFFASTMSIYGAAVTAYVNVPTGIAEARERGSLKRLHATPLPKWALLGGRIAGALGVALLTLAACVGIAAVLFHSPLPSWPAALLTFILATLCFASLGIAVISLIRSAQSGLGATLGSLLPLCFISDVFVFGAKFPDVLEKLSWFFPLRHATNAMVSTLGTATSSGAEPAWDHLGVLAVWTLVGLAVAVSRFTWETRSARTRTAPVENAAAA